MLAFIDFVPRQLRAPHFGLSVAALQGEYETFGDALAAANTWISSAGIRIVSVETVVLPNLDASFEMGSVDPVLGSAGTPLWHQFIRIWYEPDTVPDNEGVSTARFSGSAHS